MIPVARKEKLLIQEIGDELIVYDQENKASHCLNPMAASVWELCDGQHTVEDIANLLENDLNLATDENVDMRALVWLTLEELEHFHLIKEYRTQPITIPTISRRTVVKTATLVGGFAIGSMFPLVRSIIAPTPAIAAESGEPIPECELVTVIGATCTTVSVIIDNKATYSCSDSGCQKNGGSCKQRFKKGSSIPDCLCVKNANCTFSK